MTMIALSDMEHAALPAMETRTALQATGLTAGYGSRSILENFNLEVKVGERLAVIGPNGCGKSTLLRAVTGEIRATSVFLRLGDLDLDGLPTDARIRSGFGYIRQTGNVFGSLSVRENLELAALPHPASGSNRWQRALSLFPDFAQRLDTRVGLLSGGERQAVALAMALMGPVSVLLMDEPIAGLSPAAAHTILERLDTVTPGLGLAVGDGA